ncbi:MAG: aryl-sulfate sulfotransferase [Candidatus Hodarchaeota archaeon]
MCLIKVNKIINSMYFQLILTFFFLFSIFTSQFFQLEPLTSFFIFSDDAKDSALDLNENLSHPAKPFRNTLRSSRFKGDPNFNITFNKNYFDGYNLFFLEQRTSTTVLNKKLLITDMKGKIIGQKPAECENAKFINSTTIIYRSPSNATLWNIYTDKTEELNFYGHHDYDYNYLCDTFFTFQDYTVNINGTNYLFDKINEYNRAGDIVWTLNTRDFIDHTMACPYGDIAPEGIDITHSNSIFYDPDEDVLYYNARNVNTFYKIDHKTSHVLWGLGEYGNFTLFNKNGNQKDNLFYHAHAVEKVDENTFILFDNDYHNQTYPGKYRRYARIIEVTINETSMTANETWVWKSPEMYRGGTRGDADRLPNGNRLGSFTSPNHGVTDRIDVHFVEVTDDGQIAWEMNFPRNLTHKYGGFTMDRFRLSPVLASHPNEIYINASNVPTDDIIVNWQTWYNFRTNRRINGSFVLYLDGSPIQSGIHTFEKYWRSSNLTFNLGKLALGVYNVTLTLFDEAGHETTGSFNISIVPFYITRQGPIDIEYGQQNSTIQWIGGTNTPVMCNITVNDTLFSSIVWTGFDIELDLNELGIGIHTISLQLIDEFGVILTDDSFNVTIYPAQAPVIDISPLNQTIFWNESSIIRWTITDYSSTEWHILINNTLVKYGTSDLHTFLVSWSVPRYDEGYYNIAILISDELGLKTTGNVWLTILPPSPPIIIVQSLKYTFYWGQENSSILWEVRGGTNWIIRRNDSIIDFGRVVNNHIHFQIENWQSKNWFLGLHRLTLLVEDNLGKCSSTVVWIHILGNFGDAYANSEINALSFWYAFGENALGSPDNNSALIFLDYGNGYLTLDMGYGEEIIDGEGVDFTVIARGGKYNVKIGNELGEIFTNIGSGTGNQSFDLLDSGFESARYVQIEYRSGADVELDAIVAKNYNQVAEDTIPAQISGPDDFWVWKNQSQVILIWNVSDAQPMNYSVLVNGSIIESGSWHGSDITFRLNIGNKTGIIQVSLVLYDAHRNRAEDTVFIEIRIPLVPSTSTPPPSTTSYDLFALLAGISLAVLWRVRCRKNSPNK